MPVPIIIFYASLLLIRLPPLYFFPVIPVSVLTTHSLSRMGVIFLFLFMLWKKEYRTITSRQWELFALYLLFLLVHSLSALNSRDPQMFLLRYKDIVFPGLYLLASFVYLKNLKDIAYIFFYSLAFNFVYQLVMFVAPNLYILFARIFVYEGHRDFVGFNLQRGRIFIETYDEIVLPIVLGYADLFGKARGKIVKISGFIAVVIPTLLSNFRSRLLMLIVSLTGIVFGWAKQLRLLVIGAAALIVMGLAVDYISLRTLGFSLLDRVLLRSNYEDVQSLESRWEGVSNSFYLAAVHAPLGIGMGNYYENLPESTKETLFAIVGRYGAVWTSSLNPHNIFAQIAAETGLLGLIYYIPLIGYFAVSDFTLFRRLKTKNTVPVYTIAFWSLFSYSLFNPSTTLTYNTLFWVLRSLTLYESAR